MITTGKINNTILITGSGLYSISSVVFAGEASGQFREVNGNIYATIPFDSAWGRVRISSSNRGITSYSKFLFVPEPLITGFYPKTGLPLTQINLNGYSFSGVTGVTINNIAAASFTVYSNSGIVVSVPTGNTNGYIKAFGQSGLSFLSSDKFNPSALITGIDKRTLRTGELLTISGVNFLTDILDYDSLYNTCSVSFNGATGKFTVINSLKLTGIVPSLASSGPINLLKSETKDYHYSTFSATVIPSKPIVSNVSRSSGNHLENLIIYGSNFNNVTGIYYKQGSNTFIISNTGIYTVSSTNNNIYTIIPNLYSTGFSEGKTNIEIYASGGVGTGLNIFHLRGDPFITGFFPFGKENDIIRISGTNLYSDSKIHFNSESNQPLYVITGSSDNTYLDILIPGKNLKNNLIVVNNKKSTLFSTGYFTHVETPSISGYTPSSGFWGDQILITGTGFDLITGVHLNNASSNYTVVGDTGIYFQVPSGVLDSFIKVYNVAGNVFSSSALNVLAPAPIINSYYPTSVPVVSGKLTFSGSYLEYVTGIIFSGASGKFTTSNFLIDSGKNITVYPPYGSLSQKIGLKNESFETFTSSGVTILYPPTVTGCSHEYALPYTQVILSGINFSGTDFYFKSYNNDLIKSTGTQISSANVATTFIPEKIISEYIYSSGNGFLNGSNILFKPLPKIISSTLTGNSSIGSRFTFDCINGYEITGFLVSGSGQHFNIIDSYSDLTFNYPNENYVTISGYINGQFYGTGNLYPIHSGWNNFSTNVSSIFSGTKFISGINITGGIPTISGFEPRIGSYYTPILISGTNLKRVENVILSGKYFGDSEFSNIQSFKAVSDKFITGILGNVLDVITEDAEIKLRRQDWISNGIGDIYLPYPKTSETSITYLKQPHFSSILPSITEMSIFTGTHINITGYHFQSLSGAFLRDSFGSKININLASYGTNWGSPALNSEFIWVDVPSDPYIQDRVYDLCVINNANMTGMITGLKVYNYRDVVNLNDLETKIYIFS